METTLQTPISILLIGKASSTGAARLYAERNRRCPYVVDLTCKGSLVRGLYVIPEALCEFVETLPQFPERLGMEQVAVFLTRDGRSSSPWSAGQIEVKGDSAPCGSNCQRCKSYNEACPGCPATSFFQATK